MQTRKIKPGDVVWAITKSEISHPHIVIETGVDSVLVCGVTTNLKKLEMPGNVVLESGEANLEKQSVVDVSKVSAIQTSALEGYIGSLSPERLEQVLAGIRFLELISS